MSTISATVKTIQDVMRQDAGIDGDAQRIGQLAWMFFLKIFDDREAEAELLDDDYRSPIPSELRWRTWAAPKEGVTGDALLSFVNNELFPTLKQFAETSTSGRSSVIGNVFQDAFNYMKNGTLIRQVVNKINEIDFNRSEDRHLFGDIYEQILKDLQSAGNSGEYYTPRAVTQFMIDMVDPKLGETVLDPACGTGGFLTGAIEHVRANHVRTPDDEAGLQASIRGVEKKQLPHLLCTTNMLLHGVDVPTNIAHDNTLARPLRDYGSADRVDVIITNPPFGGTEEPGIENNFPQAFRTRETADLFLVLIQHLLRDGGRAAVVLPDGTLFGDGVKARIKEKLLTECNLHTVVRLPKGVFNPYTPTATNLLFFTKGGRTTDIWFFEHQYPPGYKSYSKTKPIRLEEFAAEKAWWHNRVESDVAWKVSIEDIKDGWNLDIANPNKLDAEHRDPAEVLKECDALLGEVDATRTSLRDSLADVVDDGYAQTNRETFLNSFGYITDAPDGIDKLRRLIRDLAVRGRLTRRDPDDEPVADLLARIRDERDRRAATKAVRKQQQVPDLPAADRPFVLPSAWAWVRFGNICQSRLGKMLDEEKNSGTPRKYLRNANVQWDRFDLSEVKELRLEDGELGEYELLDGDLLVVEGGYPGRCAVWDSNLADGVMVFQKALHRVRPEVGISSRFIALVLRNAVDTGRILEFFTGSGIKHLTGKKLVAVPVPLPPIGEQQRIVERVAELYEICDLLEQQLRGAESLRADLASSIAAHAIGSDTR